MTVHEKSQEQNQSSLKKGKIISSLTKGKTRVYEVELQGRDYWRTYTVEFLIENVYFFNSRLVSLDLKMTKIASGSMDLTRFETAKEDIEVFKSRKSKGELSRLVVDFSSKAKSQLLKDSVFKAACYGVKHLHINKVVI